ncbi:NAD-dependent epimerase/dehydratase family protein [Halosimplex amylolyticum]|uniref:NAD-dependent epimerase/dehydratase family protein n=1 Tax=Halosimplex amylolyticum TaxID=3396616 RepID=UPI003F548E71
MAKSILVTGSSGTVGTELVETLLADGHNVVGVDRVSNRWSDRVDDVTHLSDLCEEDALHGLDAKFDLVVHLGANARVHRLVEEPQKARENFNTTFNTLEFARRTETDFIFASSREVYGDGGKLIYAEDDTYVDECESPYTASKVGGEALVKSYQNCYGIDASILRFSNVYGKYDASNRVVPLFIATANSNDPLTVFGSDKILDFTYINDCVSGIMRSIERFHKAKGTTFNIASGEGASILELAEKIVELTDSDSEILIENNRTGEVSRYIADIQKAEKVLGFSPSYSLSDGLGKTIDWYQSHDDLYTEIQSR